MKQLDVNQLVGALSKLTNTKTAAAAESLKDPAEVGLKTETSTETQKTHGSDASGQTANLPEPGAAQPAAEAKVVPGEVAGEVPSPRAFVEGGAQKYADMRSKLAGLRFDTPSTPSTPSAPVAQPESAILKWAAAHGLPDPSAQVAGEVVGVIANTLQKSAAGRQLIEDLIAEARGADVARDLVKYAAESVEAFELAALEELEKAAQLQEIEAYAQAAYEEQAHAVHDLLKSASSDEDREKIAQSLVLLKTAASKFEENPAAFAFFTHGVRVGEKIAAQMPEGMDPAQLEAMMASEAGETPSVEEILMVLEQMVAAGEIAPEQAQQIAEMLMSEGGGAEMDPAMAEGVPPGLEGMAPEDLQGIKAAAEAHIDKVANFVANLEG